MRMDGLRLIGGAKTVDLPLLGAEESGPYVLKGAEGLGPPDIVVRLKRTVLEKAVYQGKTAALRQIIALIGLQPDWNVGQTPEQLRSELYSLLTPRYGEMIRVEVMYQGAVQAYAEGQISKPEVSLFTKDPAVQLTIDCDYGYFLHPTTIQQEPMQVAAGNGRMFVVENPGDAPAYFRMGIILGTNVIGSLVLSDSDPRGQRIQIEDIIWASGDRLVIDTRPGERGIWRGAQGGPLISILNNLDVSVSEWMALYSGENQLQLNMSAFSWDPETKFIHQPAYWGV